MEYIAADPYEGARQAYLAMNPEANDGHWEAWLASGHKDRVGELDNFRRLFEVCRTCLSSDAALEGAIEHHIRFSEGYFAALATMSQGLMQSLPVSSSVPHHANRYRRGLLSSDAQFE